MVYINQSEHKERKNKWQGLLGVRDVMLKLMRSKWSSFRLLQCFGSVDSMCIQSAFLSFIGLSVNLVV